MSDVFIGWFVLSILVGVIASAQNKSGIGFFFLSLVISPLISLIVLLMIGSKNSNSIEAESYSTNTRPSDTKVCPYCAELIKKEAIYCKHCKKDLEIKSISQIDSGSTNLHKELQNAIYDNDIVKVKQLLSNKISEADNPLAFSHMEYAKAYGNEEIIELMKQAID